MHATDCATRGLPSSLLSSSLHAMPKAFLVKQKSRGPVKADRMSESPIDFAAFYPTRVSAESIHQALFDARRFSQVQSSMIIKAADGEAIDHRKSTLDNIRNNGRLLGDGGLASIDAQIRQQRQLLQHPVRSEGIKMASSQDFPATPPITIATMPQQSHCATTKMTSSNNSTTTGLSDGSRAQLSAYLPSSNTTAPKLTTESAFPGLTPQEAGQPSPGGIIGSNWIYGRLPVAAIPGFSVPTAAAAAAAAAFFGCSPSSSSASLWASCLQRLSSGNFNTQPDWPVMSGGFRYASDAPGFPLGSKVATSSTEEKIAGLGNMGTAFWPPWHDQLHHQGSRLVSESDGGAKSTSRPRFIPSPKSDNVALAEPLVDGRITTFRRPEIANTITSAPLAAVHDDDQPTSVEQVSGETVIDDVDDDDRMQSTRRRAQIPPRFQCEACAKSYSTANGLTKHREFHCTATAAGRARRQFVCPHCVAIATASGGGETSPTGSSSSSSGSSLASAAVAAAKTYSSIGALKMHIRTHTLPCRCPQCGKAFSRPWLLQGHLRTHTGERPFQCSECRRSFADRSNLRAHLQTHADVKRYRCRSCSKTFSRMSLLLKHKEHGTGCC